MRLRIGNQSAYAAPSLLAPFEFAVEHGFDAFEFFPDEPGPGLGWSEKDLDASARARIRRLARERDVRLSVHASLRATPVSDEGLALLGRDILLARDLDARVVNIHLDLSRGMEAFVSGVLAVVDDLGSLGIDLAVENTPMTGPEAFNELFDHLGALGLRRRCEIGLCLDLGHANLCEATRNDYLGYIDALDASVPIVHVHAHENWGDRDSHLTLFTGPSASDPRGVQGWLERLHARGFVGSVIMEQWPQPPSLLTDAFTKLQRMAADVGDGAETKRRSEPVAVARQSVEEAIGRMARADGRRKSWREKLAWVEKLLSESHEPPDLDVLSLVAIYLRFVGTGEVRCEEAGGHYRPSHHARIAGHILERLEALRTPENAFVIRRIQPWLPSTHEAFTRAEPLTRIRDIAHRNDIPKALKDEIKHTLQNKLHRNAGPEDLQTSSSLLARFEANPADYPSNFLEEFRRFHAELEEFFLARSLRDQLEAVATGAPDEHRALILAFVEEMDEAVGVEQLVRMLGAATRIRRWLRSEAAQRTGAAAQTATLAEIRLEAYGFTLLSQVNNLLAGCDEDPPWQVALTALIDLLDGLALGDVEPEECRCVANELQSWRADFDPRDRWQLRRIVASVQRARRVSTSFARHIEALFGDKIEALGAALGVDPKSRALLAEAEIRTHPVFQLSRLTGHVLQWCRGILQDSPWNVIVPGRALGRLQSIDQLDGARLDDLEPHVVLVERVEGDEVVTSSLAGIVVAHEVPHLSHLAIRARQRGVVMISSDEPAAFNRARILEGQMVVLDSASSPEGVLRLATQRDVVRSPQPEPRAVRKPPTGQLGRLWMPLEEISASTGGPKAAAARSLLLHARSKASGFVAPSGMVVPFGVMEWALRPDRGAQRGFLDLVEALRARPDQVDSVAAELQQVVRQVEVPDEIIRAALRWFGADSRLVVRSSASTEDLVDVASAGLYESVVNVGVEQVADAVREVWASLWSPRAVRTRLDEGRVDGASMAVLIQRMIPMEYAFVVHTTHPTKRDRHQIYVELVVGMGETLARADGAGAPYRLVYDERREQVEILAFDNLSEGRWPAPDGGLELRSIDHAGVRMSTDRAFQESIARRIARVCRGLADHFGGPQDVEGGVSADRVVVVQSRPQQGLASS